MIEELDYWWWLFSKWAREKWLILRGIDRDFYCQRDIEGQSKCKYQCQHCKEYYKPLEDYHKAVRAKKDNRIDKPKSMLISVK